MSAEIIRLVPKCEMDVLTEFTAGKAVQAEDRFMVD